MSISSLMPPSPPEVSKRRRAHILLSATRCFRRRGFHATSMEDICREAGIGTDALALYFKNKQEVLQALGYGSWKESTSSHPASASDPPEESALMAVLRRLTQWDGAPVEEQLDLNLWAEALRDADVRDQCLKALSESKRAYARLIAEGSFAMGTPELDRGVAQLLHAASLGLEVQHALGAPQDFRAVESALKTLLSFKKKRSLLRKLAHPKTQQRPSLRPKLGSLRPKKPL